MKPLLASVLALVTACATSFQGEANVPGGPQGCSQVCASWGMVLVGMIQMGEYSDGCICQVPNLPPPPPGATPGAPGTVLQGTAAAAPAVAGVIMQMRRQAQRQQQR